MKSSLEQLVNIGPAVANRLRKVNIQTKEDFNDQDPFSIYQELKLKHEPSLSIHFLSALVGAKIGVPWYLIHEEVKKQYLEKEEARQRSN